MNLPLSFVLWNNLHYLQWIAWFWVILLKITFQTANACVNMRWQFKSVGLHCRGIRVFYIYMNCQNNSMGNCMYIQCEVTDVTLLIPCKLSFHVYVFYNNIYKCIGNVGILLHYYECLQLKTNINTLQLFTWWIVKSLQKSLFKYTWMRLETTNMESSFPWLGIKMPVTQCSSKGRVLYNMLIQYPLGIADNSLL